MSIIAELEQNMPRQLAFGERITITTRRFTAADLLTLSGDGSRRYELQKGVLTIMSPAGSEHGALAMKIGIRLGIFVEQHNLGVVFAAETGFKVEADPDTVLAPDVAFVQTARIPPEGVPSTFFSGPPDLAIEVVSPSDRTTKVEAKAQSWLEYGTQLVWVVTPQTRMVSVYRPDGSVDHLAEGATLEGEGVLPGFRYELTRFWA